MALANSVGGYLVIRQAKSRHTRIRREEINKYTGIL